MTMIEVSGPVNVKKDKTKIQSQLKSTFRRKETKSCTAYNLGGVSLGRKRGVNSTAENIRLGNIGLGSIRTC